MTTQDQIDTKNDNNDHASHSSYYCCSDFHKVTNLAIEAQDTSFEQGIIHNPTCIGNNSGEIKMRHFLSTYTTQNLVPWEDEVKKPDYDSWEGKLPHFEYSETLGKSP